MKTRDRLEMLRAVVAVALIVLTSSVADVNGKYNCENIRRHSANNTCNNTVCPNDITRTLDSFLHNYDNRIRPNFPEGVPLDIYSYIYVTGFGPVSEQDMDYTLDVFFRQRWKDSRLDFRNISGDIKELKLSNKMVDRIWTPDTFFRNGEQKSIAHKITVPNSLLRIEPDGSILYTMRLTIKAKCMMSLIDFPMDVHTCNLVYGSFGYTDEHIRFHWYGSRNGNGTKPVEIPDDSNRLNQFKLMDFSWTNGTIRTPSGSFSTLEVRLYLKRQLGYFIVQTYLPCILIVILSQMSFWVNKKAVPARTVFGIMTILNLATLSISTRQQLPKVSYTTAMDLYIVTCFVFCFLSLIEFASVNYSETNRSTKVPELKPKTKGKVKTAAGGEKGGSKNNGKLITCPLDKADLRHPELQKKILRIHIAEAVVDVSLKDLMLIASSDQMMTSQPRNDNNFVSRMFSSLTSFLSVDTTKNKPLLKGPIPERDVMLARKLCAVAKEYIYDVLTSKDRVSPIDRHAKIFFPVLFAIFNAIYWITYFSHRRTVEERMEIERNALL